MRQLIAVTALLLGAACSKPPMFHVTTVNPDAPVDVIGIFQGKEYALSVDRTNVPLYIAYYEPIGTEDVGKDFPARVEAGAVVMEVPGRGAVRYTIQSVRVK